MSGRGCCCTWGGCRRRSRLNGCGRYSTTCRAPAWRLWGMARPGAGWKSYSPVRRPCLRGIYVAANPPANLCVRRSIRFPGRQRNFWLHRFRSDGLGFAGGDGKHRWPTDFVRHGETGWLAEPDNDAALLAGVRHLLQDKPLRKKMGAAARAHAETMTWSAVCDLLLQTYHSLSRTVPPDITSTPSAILSSAE